MTKKPLPTIRWKNFAPPYYEYDYFQGAEEFPFRPTAGEFDLVNAWWLSEITTLVYAEEAFVTSRLESVGFPHVRYFGGQSTDCFVAHNDRWIVVAFRGTESRPRPDAPTDFQHILADVKADCNILLVDAIRGGKVHKGFSEALDEVWESLLAHIQTIHTASRSLWIAGHSLGAALATLAADRYHEPIQGVYTFGSPRVGNKEFGEHVASLQLYRLINNNDIVTTVPLPGIYRHVGEVWYINSEGVIQQEVPLTEMMVESIRGEACNIAQSVEDMMQGTFTYVPGALKDHLPLLYTIHLWNNMIENPAVVKENV